MKKFLIIIVIIALTAGAVWYFFFNRQTDGLNGSGTGGTTQPPADFGLKILGTKLVSDYWIEAAGEAIFYISPDGFISRLGPDGTEERLLDQPLNNLLSLQPSFNQEFILMELGSRLNPVFSILDIKNLSWTPLPEDTVAAAWSPNDLRLTYLKETGAIASINILNAANDQTSEVFRLAQKDLGLEWLAPDKIYLTQRPAAGLISSLWSLNIKDRTLTPIVVDEPGLMILWAPDGELGLKFTSVFRSGRLDLIDGSNKSLGAPVFSSALPQKCVFHDTVLYCAVPQNIPASAILPDDYLKRKFYSQDALLAWDRNTDKIRVLDDGQKSLIDAEQLTKQGNKLFFINRYDRKLYSLEIPE